MPFLGRMMCGQNAEFLHVKVRTVYSYCLAQCISRYSMHYVQCVNKSHKYVPSQKKINYICAVQNF